MQQQNQNQQPFPLASPIPNLESIQLMNSLGPSTPVRYFMVSKYQVATCIIHESTLQTVAKLFIDRNVSSVVVVDAKKDDIPVGIVTKTDLIVAIFLHNKPVDTLVDEVMSRELEYIDLDSSIQTCADVMTNTKKHHLLVRDQQGQFCGIVSSKDIAREASLDPRKLNFR